MVETGSTLKGMERMLQDDWSLLGQDGGRKENEEHTLHLAQVFDAQDGGEPWDSGKLLLHHEAQPPTRSRELFEVLSGPIPAPGNLTSHLFAIMTNIY